MQVETLRTTTAARLAIISIDTTLRAAACALSSAQIGLAVVCDASGRVAGVVSKSDVVRHIANVGAADAPIADLMSGDVVSCRPEDDLYVTWQKMTAQSLQNMPLLDADAKPVGVLDVRDALKVLFEQEEYQERLLINYVAGVGYQ